MIMDQIVFAELHIETPSLILELKLDFCFCWTTYRDAEFDSGIELEFCWTTYKDTKFECLSSEIETTWLENTLHKTNNY